MDRPGQLRTFDKVKRICYAENIFFFTFALQLGWICSWRNKTNQFLQRVGGPHFFEPFPICVFGWITPLYHCVLFWGGRHTFSHESGLEKETPVIDHSVTELRFGQRPKKGAVPHRPLPRKQIWTKLPTHTSFMSPSTLAPLFLHLYVLLIRVSHKTQNVSDRAPNGAYAVSICGDSWKISDFYLHFWPDASRFSILAFLEGKTAPKRWKIWVFQNWLDTRPKIKTQDPNVCSIILGGVSRRFWNPLLDLGARSALFWHLWGAFGQNTSPTLQCV